MAQWKFMGHAESSLVLLGRIGGLSNKEIYSDSEAGDRNEVIVAATKAAPSPSPQPSN
jgi:hypothetical protein